MPDAVTAGGHSLAPSYWTSRNSPGYRYEPPWDADAERQRAEEMSEHFERRRQITAQVERLQLAWRPSGIQNGIDASAIDITSNSSDAWEPLLMSPSDARFDGLKFATSSQLQRAPEHRATTFATSSYPTPGPSSLMDDLRNYLPAIDAMSYEDLLVLAVRVGPARPAGATRRAISIGLDRSQFSSMSRMEIIPPERRLETRCHICLEDYKNGDPIASGRNCIHGGHANCLEKWLLRHNSCPICRSTVV